MTTTTTTPTTSLRLASDPFVSLRYHFGMLLGVEDLEVEQAYHRGKQWLHNCWLHGEGVVWGLGASFDDETLEVRVAPGLALDAAGRELSLPYLACVHLGRWFAEHRDTSAFGFTETAQGVDFTARVVIRFNACLERPVPAISHTCTNAAVATAHSRTRELPVLELRPATDPVSGDPAPRSHLVRLLFGLDEPAVDAAGDLVADDRDVLDTIAAIAALAPAEQPATTLAALRRFAARDTLAHAPAEPGSPLPVEADTAVVLTEVAVTGLAGSDEAGWTVESVRVDNDVRPSLIATRTIQELHARAAPAPSTDAGRLRVDRVSLTRTAPDTLQLDLLGEALAGSLADAVGVTAWDDAAGSWRSIATILTLGPASGPPTRQALTVTLSGAPADDDLLRLVIRGTGPTPLLGADHLPLAGGSDGPTASAHDGLDFVHMARASAL